MKRSLESRRGATATRGLRRGRGDAEEACDGTGGGERDVRSSR